MLRIVTWVTLLVLPWSWCASRVSAQNLVSRVLGAGGGGAEKNRPETPALTMAEVEEAIERLQRQVAQLREQDAAATVVPWRQSELDLWRRIRLEMQQIDAVQSQNVDLEARRNRLQQQRGDGEQEPTAPFPVTFLAVDELRDERYAQRQQQKTVETEVELARDKRQQAWHRRDNAERRFRAGQELAARSAGAAAPEEQANLERMRLEQFLAEQHVRLAQAELTQQELLQQIIDEEYRQLDLRIERTLPAAVFAEAELQQIVVRVDRRQQTLEQQSLELQGLAQSTEEQLQSARAEVTDDATHDEYLRTLQLRLRALQTHEQFLHHQAERARAEREVWQRRFQAVNKVASNEAKNRWCDEARQAQKDLDRARRLMTARLDNFRNELVAMEAKVPSAAAVSPAILQYRQRQVREVRQLTKLCEDELADLRNHRWQHTKLLEDLKHVGAIAAAAALVDNSWKRVEAVWNYEIVQVEGSPITVKKVVIGLGLVLIGSLLSRWAAWCLAKTILPRFGIQGNAAMPFRTIAFYVFFLTFTLFALRIVCVPLTAFTVIGGALAIGVGVGSQGIANNFISGLILLVERPLRVGDTVEVDGVFGVVENIGARSTRVRTVTNLEVILPNSKLLEQHLVNWTLSDDRIRTSVGVGIAYGSPTERAADLMLLAARECSEILTVPEPRVFFADFGDNALSFEIHFWVRLSRGVERRLIESHLRFSIERLFRRENIVVAYPQRDIHLDVTHPIPVQIASEAAGAQRQAA